MTVLTIVVVAAVGVLAGAVGSLLGLGGGIFLVPFLVVGLGLPFQSAAGISLMTVIATSSAVSAHAAGQGLFNLRLGLVLEIATTLGGLTGGLTAAYLSLPVLSALHHAHGQRICHRDLKPANILRSHLGVVKLIDFGLALQEAQQRLSQTGEYLGTPNYFAPERSSPHAPEVEPFSDQYALGVSLFEAVTGRLPFQASDPIAMLHHHLHSRPPRPGEFRSDCPAELELAILKLLNKEPHQRFANLKELEQVLAVSLGLTPNSDPDPLSQTMAFE